MTLEALLKNTEYKLVKGKLDRPVTSLTHDSRKVKDGTAFVCISGTVRDAHDFIPEAIKNGASKVIGEKDLKLSVP